VTGLRFLFAGLFWIAYRSGSAIYSVALVTLAFGSDVLDGVLSRKCQVSALGGYLDAIADFFFIIVVYVCFWAVGIYAWWVLALIAAMFAQFVITSGLRRPRYDPVGKYIGVYLYLAAGLTLLWPQRLVYAAVSLGLVALALAALASRAAHLRPHGRA
jgi:CDP-diacylglycerol--glycerol-3-phosphate 3-phosphatidyltransferase/cardiolipin synthase